MEGSGKRSKCNIFKIWITLPFVVFVWCWIMNKGVIVFRGEEERKTDREDEKRGRKTRRGCSLSLVVSGSSNMGIYHKTSIPRLPTWC